MMKLFAVLGVAALVGGAAGQARYKPGGAASSSSSGGFSGGSGSFSGGSGSFSGGSGGFSGGSGGFSGSSSGNSFASAPRPGGGSFGGSGSSSGSGSGSLEDAIPGVPGDDYPIFAEVPETSFLCDGQVEGGYYADVETDCQAFHICASDGQDGLTKYSFLCPNGTLFNQEFFVCDWWFNVDCSLAEQLYSRNDEIAAEREAYSGGSQGGAAGNQRGNQRGGNLGGNQRGGSQVARGQAGQGSRTSTNGGRTSSGGSRGSSAAGGVQFRGSASGSRGSVAGGRRGSQGSASGAQTAYAVPDQSFSGSLAGGFQSADVGYGAPGGGFGGSSAAVGSLGSYARNTRDLDNELVADVMKLEEEEVDAVQAEE